jgi:uncharacterized protein (DUF58 family)
MWKGIKKFGEQLFLTNRFFGLMVSIIGFFVLGHFFNLFYSIAEFSLLVLVALLFLDILLLFNSPPNPVFAIREIAARMSNGDENPVKLFLRSNYRFKVKLIVIDEIPAQFQDRNFEKQIWIESQQENTLLYKLYPVKRGEYLFGKILNCLCQFRIFY